MINNQPNTNIFFIYMLMINSTHMYNVSYCSCNSSNIHKNANKAHYKLQP